MENQRAIALTFIAGGVGVGLLVRSATRALMAAMVWEDPTLGGLLSLSAILGVVSGIAGFAILMRHQKASSFVDEVAIEMRRVIWPGRDETVNNTGIVVGATIFFALLLSVYDYVWANITEVVLYSG